MALIQSLSENTLKTFNDIGAQVLQKILSLFTGSLQNGQITCIVLVFDRYDFPLSIKWQKIQRRWSLVNHGNALCLITEHISKVVVAKQISALLFVTTLWAKGLRISLNVSVILAHGFKDGDRVQKVKSCDVTNIPELFSTHKEADTRMLLHVIRPWWWFSPNCCAVWCHVQTGCMEAGRGKDSDEGVIPSCLCVGRRLNRLGPRACLLGLCM